ncbi:MAG: hypothetical protein LLF76_13915 [Planctomycetaceae bacterium]|nr:hypothetical protein [Planctomycetaceae bacterium]
MTASVKTHFKPAFIICAVILLTAAASKEAVIRVFGVHMTKEAIAPQHSFEQFSEAALLPYVVKDKSKIENRDVLESLGTEEYLQWIVEDPTAPAGSPTRYGSIFITYYTGNPDMVPHVPDECYVGGGNLLQGTETLAVDIPIQSRPEKIAFQYALFTRTNKEWMKDETFSVQYLFHANGDYCGSRTEARWALGSNWFCKYSYFCKVEWKFYGFDSFGLVYPDRSQTLEASRKLLPLLLSELERNHWPDRQIFKGPNE